jgi:hypothetical protein
MIPVLDGCLCGGVLRTMRHQLGRVIRAKSGLIGRGDKIRTCDPLHPMQVRYQAAPRPDRSANDSAKAPATPYVSMERQRRNILISSSNSSRIWWMSC